MNWKQFLTEKVLGECWHEMTRDEEISSLKDRCAGYCNGQEQLQSILSGVMDSNAKWAEEVATLKQQIENLKCCGNCKHIAYDEQTGELSCENDYYPFHVTGRCDNWTFDGKTREERK
jgi:hypothetical protein